MSLQRRFLAQTEATRYETYQGKKHLVVPVIALAPGDGYTAIWNR